jgi:hypothetical protein
MALQKIAMEKNMLLYFDAVLNHKASADATEKCRAIQVQWDGTHSPRTHTDKIVTKRLAMFARLRLGLDTLFLVEDKNILLCHGIGIISLALIGFVTLWGLMGRMIFRRRMLFSGSLGMESIGLLVLIRKRGIMIT